MTHYLAIIEDAGPEVAVGVWFPDLPGCTSAGDSLDDALKNAPEALELYADTYMDDGRQLPPPRSLAELKADPNVSGDISKYIVALIELPSRAARAAE